MIDINKLRDEPERLKRTTRDKGFNPKLIDKALKLDKKKRLLQQEVELLRQMKNVISEQRVVLKELNEALCS